ncbi:hypothetical protein NEOLEDRAFT_1179939 [Neolentinus lepideus HHB14362 ss-1]|uniref:ELYS-like domain-containing protein n=1 Tax=Neolentinus lepideus HHB14362 ss-1 TaxID=1314782 RepID=A0A165RF60_9AGAM|nr:hypothetical protein NEOLEDRAFT_1179939 [Neolentinus lepideus HHB14362 ss-1]
MDTTDEDISLSFDVDEQRPEQQQRSAARDPWTYFSCTPESFPWTPSLREEIESRRAKLSDCLLFDLLLRMGNIADPASLYPPADLDALQNLLQALDNTRYDSLKRDCLYYYLLRFYADDRAGDYVEHKTVPPQFVGVAAAYWCLDNATDIPRAISYLSDARVKRNEIPKIMEVLSHESDANRLIRQYVRTVRPHLMAPKDITIYLIALAESSLWEAWQYQRSFLQQSEMRDKLIRKILKWMLSPEPRPLALTQLLSFPLNAFEEAILQDFALHPPPSTPQISIPILQDLVCVRLVRVGDYTAAIKYDRQFTLRTLGHTGKESSLDVAQKMAVERRKMLDELMSLMPEIERQLLEEELEDLSLGKVKPSSGRLSMTWNPDRTPLLPDDSPHRPNYKPHTVISPSNLGKNDNLFVSAPKPRKKTIFDAIKPSNVPPPPIITPHTQNYPGSSVTQLPNGFLGLGNPSATSPFAKGSANTTPNAFFDPSRKQIKLPARLTERRISAPVPMDVERPPTPPSLAISDQEKQREERDGDVTMASVSETGNQQPAAEPSKDQAPPQEQLSKEQPKEHPAPMQEADILTTEFSASVFGTSRPPAPAPSASQSKQADRSLSESPRKVPGAFDPNETIDSPSPEPEPNPELHFFSSSHSNASAAAMFTNGNGHRDHSPSPTPKRTRGQINDTNPTPAKKKKDSGRSLPGTLIPDEDEDEDEDEVPPLPPSPVKPSRKGRSRGSSDEDESNFRPRRSTRLSTISSVGSIASPEISRQTRRTATPVSKPNTRRKR